MAPTTPLHHVSIDRNAWEWLKERLRTLESRETLHSHECSHLAQRCASLKHRIYAAVDIALKARQELEVERRKRVGAVNDLEAQLLEARREGVSLRAANRFAERELQAMRQANREQLLDLAHTKDCLVASRREAQRMAQGMLQALADLDEARAEGVTRPHLAASEVLKQQDDYRERARLAAEARRLVVNAAANAVVDLMAYGTSVCFMPTRFTHLISQQELDHEITALQIGAAAGANPHPLRGCASTFGD